MIPLAVVAAIAVIGLLWREHDHAAQHRLEREDWALERRELLNRIQAPGLIPQTREAPLPEPTPPSPDEMMLANLGQIVPAHVLDEWEQNGHGG